VSRSWELFLRDMLEAARKVIRFTADRQLESFVADEMAYDATLRNLELGNQQRVRFADGCINLNPARRADLDGTSSPGAGLHNLRDDEIWDDDAAIQRRQQLELRNACQGNQRSRIADDRALVQAENSRSRSTSSRSATGTPERPASKMKSTLFIPHSSAALPEERRPSSKSLSASRSFASRTNSSCDCPVLRRTLSGRSIWIVLMALLSAWRLETRKHEHLAV
jgi:hypothetical protein